MWDIVEKVDFEESSIEMFKENLTKHYDKSWPGHIPNFYFIDYLHQGKAFIKELYNKRGYDMYGKAL
jgi:hypothetical protein